jgi:hypothetical protein
MAMGGVVAVRPNQSVFQAVVGRSAVALSIFLTIGSLAFVCGGQAADTGSVSAADARRTWLPPPQGLQACPADSPLTAMFDRLASQSGDLVGCFVSIEKVPMHGVLKTVDRPLEYVFAIRFAVRTPGPYTPADINSQLSRVQQEWKHAEPWEQAKPKYEKRAAELIQETMDQTPDKPVVSLEQPRLFSIERVAPESFVVVSIRQRRIGVAGDSFVSTAVDGSAVIVLGTRIKRN